MDVTYNAIEHHSSSKAAPRHRHSNTTAPQELCRSEGEVKTDSQSESPTQCSTPGRVWVTVYRPTSTRSRSKEVFNSSRVEAHDHRVVVVSEWVSMQDLPCGDTFDIVIVDGEECDDNVRTGNTDVSV